MSMFKSILLIFDILFNIDLILGCTGFFYAATFSIRRCTCGRQKLKNLQKLNSFFQSILDHLISQIYQTIQRSSLVFDMTACRQNVVRQTYTIHCTTFRRSYSSLRIIHQPFYRCISNRRKKTRRISVFHFARPPFMVPLPHNNDNRSTAYLICCRQIVIRPFHATVAYHCRTTANRRGDDL